MVFNSKEFLAFFPIVLIIYYLIPRKIKYLWLLIASYYFYMCWNAKYALLILGSTIITYLSGLIIEIIKKSKLPIEWKDRRKKVVVAISLILNLTILFYFKYSNFALKMVLMAFRELHIELNIPQFDIILPVGISFYTFQALSYTMDVYRNEIYAEKNFFRYALFVSFFPQLVAGPIERSKNLLKQLAILPKFDSNMAREGVLLMLWGFFLKIVLADRIAIFVDTIYGDYRSYAWYYLIAATILFAIQIYCDFYGYSTIAMGTAKILGIQLMENFDAPYLSISVSEFWKRWHISLTSWFKDYLYIPLGGSRKGKMRKYINKMIVFLVSGLWHGTSVSFVLWGGVNGMYQVIGEILQPIRDNIVSVFRLNRKSIAHRMFQTIATFVLIDFSWIFFRANSFRESFGIIKRIITMRGGSLYNCGLDIKNFCLMVISIGILLLADLCKYRKVKVCELIAKQDYWFRCIFITLSIYAILIFGIYGANYNASGFIYFQF